MENWIKYSLIVILFLLYFISKTKKNKKRTAILVFGQPRTYKKCYQSLFDNIINQNNHNFDIYLITWKKDYNEELLKYYKPKDVLLLEYDDFLKDLDTINKLKIGFKYQNPCGGGGSKVKNTYFVQLWQWYKGYQFVKEKKYDYIVRTRFDNLFNKSIKIDNTIFKKNLGSHKIYKDSNNILDDIFFVIKKEDSCILEIWKNQDKLDFIDENYIKNYTNKLKNNEYLMDLETLVTIYVKDYKKYDYKLISMDNVNVIR